MKLLTYGVGVMAGILVTTQVHAVKITNNDTVDQALTIIEGGKETKLVLAPGQAGEGICAAGCIIRMQNGDEYEFEGPEVVVIEGEALFLEEVPQGDGVIQNPDAPRQQ